MALLNSKLLEWYFLLGSSNSKVNEYQFNNLPCPVFKATVVENDREITNQISRLVSSAKWGDLWDLVHELDLCRPPLPRAAETLLRLLAGRICEIEQNRGPVSKIARAHLASESEPIQHLIDRLLFAMAGFSDQEVKQLETRLEGLV